MLTTCRNHLAAYSCLSSHTVSLTSSPSSLPQHHPHSIILMVILTSHHFHSFTISLPPHPPPSHPHSFTSSLPYHPHSLTIFLPNHPHSFTFSIPHHPHSLTILLPHLTPSPSSPSSSLTILALFPGRVRTGLSPSLLSHQLIPILTPSPSPPSSLPHHPPPI